MVFLRSAKPDGTETREAERARWRQPRDVRRDRAADRLAGDAARSAALRPRVEARGPPVADPLAAAFAATFWWAVAVVPTGVLALSQRKARRARQLAEAGSPVA